ncbi:MAG: hypothetical protein Q8N37_01715 [bacterium]|nr:hypothetical protein [bacterium]
MRVGIEPLDIRTKKGIMEDGDDSTKDPLEEWKKDVVGKKSKYLRLGYIESPRRKTEMKKETFKYPGEKKHCGSCKSANIIPPEALLKGEVPFENLCGDSSCDACRECGGERKGI